MCISKVIIGFSKKKKEDIIGWRKFLSIDPYALYTLEIKDFFWSNRCSE
jgi:hypothetical protein